VLRGREFFEPEMKDVCGLHEMKNVLYQKACWRLMIKRESLLKT
jgi:hypothetical protein